jgi:hypothetical protein
MIKEAPDWTPWHNHYGEHSRIFTDEQEDDLEDLIMRNWVDRNRLLTNDDFKEIAIEFWLQIAAAQGSEEAEMEYISRHPFSCSAGFIADFKRAHDISSRRSRFKRRSDADVGMMNTWITETTQYLVDKPREQIINCDETCWLVLPGNLLTWARKGAESVYIVPEGGGKQKERLTVHATIRANGTKLPLLFIAEGKTHVVEETQIGDIGEHWKAHTKTGWQTQESFLIYLELLRGYIRDGASGEDRIYLIIDLYKAHMTEAVRQRAHELNIELIFIPPGCTDELQPLDRKVFGPLKAKAKHQYRMGLRLGRERGKRQACQDMLQVWNELGENVIKSAWAHLIPEFQAEVADAIGEDEDESSGRWTG